MGNLIEEIVADRGDDEAYDDQYREHYQYAYNHCVCDLKGCAQNIFFQIDIANIEFIFGIVFRIRI